MWQSVAWALIRGWRGYYAAGEFSADLLIILVFRWWRFVVFGGFRCSTAVAFVKDFRVGA